MRKTICPKRLRAQLMSLLLLCQAIPLFAEPLPNALPGGYQSVSGNVNFNQNGNTLNVTSGSQASIANYQSFNVGQNATVNFNLPNSNSAILNRVIGPASSEIFGSINSNGKVFLVNPSGILFGQTAQVNVGSLIASTLNINDNDFLKGNYFFRQDGKSASIENQGSINISEGGQLVFMAGSISNSGNINAPLGSIHLLVGKEVSLALDDKIGISFQIDKALDEQVKGIQNAILNSGSIKANGGLISLQAQLADIFYERAVNNKGLLQASELSGQGGQIELVAVSNSLSNPSIVENAGTIEALGNTSGGRVVLLGDLVGLTGNSSIDASGLKAGGEVLIGGDYAGESPVLTDTPFIKEGQGVLSQKTFVGPDAVIKADALLSGNGGKVIVWSEKNTNFLGSISAKGGLESGNGGFVEISSKEILNAKGNIDLSAKAGKSGTLLYDPLDILIVGGSGDGDDNTDGSSTQLINDWQSNTLGLINFADEGSGSPNPFVIYQSEIEGSNSNIRLEARNSITTQGSFDNSGSLIVSNGNNLELITRNSPGDGVGGIDLTTSIHGSDLSVQALGGGYINIRTGEDPSGQAAPIRTGNLTANLGYIDLKTVGGDITTGNLSAGGGSINLSTVPSLLSFPNAGSIQVNGNIQTSADFGAINLNSYSSIGTGGDINISGNVGTSGLNAPIQISSYTKANSNGLAANAGDVTINGALSTLQDFSSINVDSSSAGFSSTAGLDSISSQGGNIEIESVSSSGNNSSITLQSYSQADSGGDSNTIAGNGGNIIINQNLQTLGSDSGISLQSYSQGTDYSGFSNAVSSANAGSVNVGGNLLLASSNPSLTINSYSQAFSNESSSSSGTGGNIVLNVLNAPLASNSSINLNSYSQANSSFSTALSGGAGSISFLNNSNSTFGYNYFNSSSQAYGGMLAISGNGNHINFLGDITQSADFAQISFNASSVAQSANSSAQAGNGGNINQSGNIQITGNSTNLNFDTSSQSNANNGNSSTADGGIISLIGSITSAQDNSYFNFNASSNAQGSGGNVSGGSGGLILLNASLQTTGQNSGLNFNADSSASLYNGGPFTAQSATAGNISTGLGSAQLLTLGDFSQISLSSNSNANNNTSGTAISGNGGDISYNGLIETSGLNSNINLSLRSASWANDTAQAGNSGNFTSQANFITNKASSYINLNADSNANAQNSTISGNSGSVTLNTSNFESKDINSGINVSSNTAANSSAPGSSAISGSSGNISFAGSFIGLGDSSNINISSNSSANSQGLAQSGNAGSVTSLASASIFTQGLFSGININSQSLTNGLTQSAGNSGNLSIQGQYTVLGDFGGININSQSTANNSIGIGTATSGQAGNINLQAGLLTQGQNSGINIYSSSYASSQADAISLSAGNVTLSSLLPLSTSGNFSGINIGSRSQAYNNGVGNVVLGTAGSVSVTQNVSTVGSGSSIYVDSQSNGSNNAQGVGNNIFINGNFTTASSDSSIGMNSAGGDISGNALLSTASSSNSDIFIQTIQAGDIFGNLQLNSPSNIFVGNEEGDILLNSTPEQVQSSNLTLINNSGDVFVNSAVDTLQMTSANGLPSAAANFVINEKDDLILQPTYVGNFSTVTVNSPGTVSSFYLIGGEIEINANDIQFINTPLGTFLTEADLRNFLVNVFGVDDTYFNLEGFTIGLNRVSLNATNDIALSSFTVYSAGHVNMNALGNISGLDANSFPRIMAPNVQISAAQVASPNAPLAILGSNLLSFSLADASNQSGFGGVLGLPQFTSLELDTTGIFRLYPSLIPPSVFNLGPLLMGEVYSLLPSVYTNETNQIFNSLNEHSYGVSSVKNISENIQTNNNLPSNNPAQCSLEISASGAVIRSATGSSDCSNLQTSHNFSF